MNFFNLFVPVMLDFTKFIKLVVFIIGSFLDNFFLLFLLFLFLGFILLALLNFLLIKILPVLLWVFLVEKRQVLSVV
jgi:hypothetical protein